jgi:hypothetical protein
MFLHKDTDASYNFKAPKVTADAEKKIEVLFPSVETQTPAYAATIAVAVVQMHTNVAIALTGNATINTTVDGEVTTNAEMILKLTADGTDRVVTLGTGMSGSTINVPANSTVYALLKYDGTNFYAITSSNDNVQDGAITTDKLAADAVTGDKIADDSIGAEHIIDLAVGTAALAADAVDGTKIADDSIGAEHIIDLAVGTAALALDAVTADQIADDAVTNDHIADDAVDTDQIADDAVTGDQIADDAIGSEHIADDAVTSDHIADGSVGPLKLTGGVDPGDILYWDGTNWVILPIGTGGQVLKVSTAAPNLPVWATP